MRKDVYYNLDISLKNKIICVKDLILESLEKSEIYLFGSIAKGRYSKDSDIDILVLIDEEIDKRELRRLRHSLEDKVEDISLERDVDIKLYSKSNYIELSKKVSFEKAILKDLIDLKGWTYGK